MKNLLLILVKCFWVKLKILSNSLFLTFDCLTTLTREMDLQIAMPLPILLLPRKYGSLNHFPESPRESLEIRESPAALNDQCK